MPGYANCRDERRIERRDAKSEFWCLVTPAPFKGLLHPVALILTIFQHLHAQLWAYLAIPARIPNAKYHKISPTEVPSPGHGAHRPPETIAKHPIDAESFSFFCRLTPATQRERDWRTHTLSSTDGCMTLHCLHGWFTLRFASTCNWHQLAIIPIEPARISLILPSFSSEPVPLNLSFHTGLSPNFPF